MPRSTADWTAMGFPVSASLIVPETSGSIQGYRDFFIRNLHRLQIDFSGNPAWEAFREKPIVRAHVPLEPALGVGREVKPQVGARALPVVHVHERPLDWPTRSIFNVSFEDLPRRQPELNRGNTGDGLEGFRGRSPAVGLRNQHDLCPAGTCGRTNRPPASDATQVASVFRSLICCSSSARGSPPTTGRPASSRMRPWFHAPAHDLFVRLIAESVQQGNVLRLGHSAIRKFVHGTNRRPRNPDAKDTDNMNCIPRGYDSAIGLGHRFVRRTL